MTEPLGGASAPPAGGIDLDLPGTEVRLRATRWPGSSPPVVLLHGLASQRRFWGPVASRLAGAGLLALDQRGHGDSERPEVDEHGGYSMATVVGDLATALDAIGWSRAVIVGHSWGAAVALSFAAAHPERTLAVVAIDGGFLPPSLEPRDEVRRRMEPPRFAAPPDELTSMLRGGSLADWWSAEVEAAVLPIFGVGPDGLARPRLPFDRHMAIVDALIDLDPANVLPAVSCAAWLVSCEPAVGMDDWSERRVAGLEQASRMLPRGRLMRWAGAIHDVPLQWPALVAGLIRAAADEVGARGQQ